MFLTGEPRLKSILIAVVCCACAVLPATAQVVLESKTAGLIDDLVSANRVLASQGVLDGFGHVSARSIADPSHFYMARSVAPSSVSSTDIMEFDRDGRPLGLESRVPYVERFIHSEIYKARPDVMAVVHGHTPSVIPFSVTNVTLKPIYHMSGFLGKGAPVFDIREAAGASPDTDLLVKTPALGAKLAEKLGAASVVLMRGHGFTAVAGSVPVAVFRSVYTDQNARIQTEALRLGQPRFLSEREAALTEKTMEPLSERSWDMWKKQPGLLR